LIYAFRTWRMELNRLSDNISAAAADLKSISSLGPEKHSINKESARIQLLNGAYDRLFMAFLTSSFIMRKMDDAAKYPFPAGKMLASKTDRQLKKRLCKYQFESVVGEETGESGSRTISPESAVTYDGRQVTNLAMHSEEMRLHPPPVSGQEGFWIRSDKKPIKSDSSKYWFLDLEDFSQMLNDFKDDPWKDI